MVAHMVHYGAYSGYQPTNMPHLRRVLRLATRDSLFGSWRRIKGCYQNFLDLEDNDKTKKIWEFSKEN
jgi:hypothetical protein